MAAIFSLCVMAAPPPVAAESGRPVAQLVANCAACHRLDNQPTGIPPIIGLDAHQLIAMLRGFKSRPQANHVMRAVGRALSDEDIVMLASYLAALKPEARPR